MSRATGGAVLAPLPVLAVEGRSAGFVHAPVANERHLGGLREAVLARDGRRCRVCHKPERGKRSLARTTGYRAAQRWGWG